MVKAIVQARMGSTRLPNKVMRDLNGEPMLVRVVNRVNRVVETVVATTTQPEDDVIEQVCEQYGWSCFRGSEIDVLDRYYQAAKYFKLTDIIRITSDCPLMDSGVLKDMIEIYKHSDVDYLSNILVRTYPKGLDVEIFSFTALEKAWNEATDPYDREHVTPYIIRHPDLFKRGNVENETDLSHLRWTVDYQEDLDFVREIYSNLGEGFTMEDVLKYQKGGKVNVSLW